MINFLSHVEPLSYGYYCFQSAVEGVVVVVVVKVVDHFIFNNDLRI